MPIVTNQLKIITAVLNEWMHYLYAYAEKPRYNETSTNYIKVSIMFHVYNIETKINK